MLNSIFERNINGLQKVIEYLGSNLDNTENKELLQSSLREYRLWIKLLLDYEDRITQMPTKSRNEILGEVVSTMKKCGTPKRWITAFYNEVKKHRWDNYEN